MTIEKRMAAESEDSVLALYLREIAQYKLLSREEEITLGKRVQKGDKAAREAMILSNLRLVVKIARDYEGLGVPLLDLISEGNIGLIKGVERFNPMKGAKFSTYGCWWIKQAIKRDLANSGRTIRLPVHMVDKVSHLIRASNKLRGELGREPTHEEIAMALGLPEARIQQILSLSQKPVSLDAKMGEDATDEKTMANVVADESAEMPYDLMGDRHDAVLIRALIAKLPPRQGKIIIARFGLDGSEMKTLEEIGGRFGLTRERIRQLEDMAKKRLRRLIEKYEKNGERELGEQNGHTNGYTNGNRASNGNGGKNGNGAEVPKPDIRASFAYEHWKPGKKKGADAALSFAKFAYEIPGELGEAGTDAAEWARSVAVYLMLRDLNVDHSAIPSSGLWPMASQIESVCLAVDRATAANSDVKEDLDGLRSHFKSTMKLKGRVGI